MVNGEGRDARQGIRGESCSCDGVSEVQGRHRHSLAGPGRKVTAALTLRVVFSPVPLGGENTMR
jgi:hypothetical protein